MIRNWGKLYTVYHCLGDHIYALQGVIVQKKEKRAAVKEGENAELLT